MVRLAIKLMNTELLEAELYEERDWQLKKQGHEIPKCSKRRGPRSKDRVDQHQAEKKKQKKEKEVSGTSSSASSGSTFWSRGARACSEEWGAQYR